MSTDPSPVPAGVNRVELKVTLAAAQVDAGLDAFSLDLAAGKPRSIWFCERLDAHGVPDVLPLLARGIILRVRRNRDRSGETTLKLRGPEGGVDPALWRGRTGALGKAAKIEGDWVGDRHLVAASLDGDVEAGRIDAVLAKRPRRLRRLLSDDQVALATELLLELDGLELLGPVDARRWELAVEGLEEVTVELWEVAGGPRFLELSVRVEEDPGGVQRRLEQAVRDGGLVVDDEQETKTKLVLQHLAGAALAG